MKMLDYVSKDDLSKFIVPEVIMLKSNKSFAAKASSLDLMSEIYPLCSIKDQ